MLLHCVGNLPHLTQSVKEEEKKKKPKMFLEITFDMESTIQKSKEKKKC